MASDKPEISAEEREAELRDVLGAAAEKLRQAVTAREVPPRIGASLAECLDELTAQLPELRESGGEHAADE
ncbi:hypothetical protein [Amycolatopsis panacis]|uniref:Uncharacterized protein n=1 Tax=Amycolatopsis panacis TaxID=2340917 RepID=A0A419IB23_9PSEU|nr:hypothetical protein [Amycolatopsis panacis]RJQ91273.1 hypothetical protein D5S19_02070 [Amycolatopsis panacis]